MVLLEFENFSLHVDRGFCETDRRRATAVVTSAMFRTWPVRVSGHGVHGVGEIFPGSGDAGNVSLSAEPAFRYRLFAATRVTLTGERVELIDHRVDGLLEQENFTADVHGDLLDKSPLAMAVDTSAILRTWPVKLLGHGS